MQTTAKTFIGLDCSLNPSSLAAGVPGTAGFFLFALWTLCQGEPSCLAAGSQHFSSQSTRVSLPPPPSSPPPPKKGGCPCVEYTACNFAVKPQPGGQCCDWLCKDLSLKGNYTKFPSEGQLSLDRIQENPHITSLFMEMLGSLWLSLALWSYFKAL